MELSVFIALIGLAGLLVSIVDLGTKLHIAQRYGPIKSYLRKRRARKALGAGGAVRRVIRSVLWSQNNLNGGSSQREFPSILLNGR